MSQDHDDFRALLERVRQGSEEAVRELLERYGRHLLAVIRQKLDNELRSAFDSLDFLQDVWASFFAGELDHTFHDPRALMQFLVTMARHKVADQWRRRRGTGQAPRARQHSLDGSARYAADGLRAGGPAPGDQVMAREEWDRLLDGRPFHHRRVLQMLALGHTHQEIAAA